MRRRAPTYRERWVKNDDSGTLGFFHEKQRDSMTSRVFSMQKSGLSTRSLPPKSAAHQSFAHAGDFYAISYKAKKAPFCEMNRKGVQERLSRAEILRQGTLRSPTAFFMGTMGLPPQPLLCFAAVLTYLFVAPQDFATSFAPSVISIRPSGKTQRASTPSSDSMNARLSSYGIRNAAVESRSA